MTSTMLILRQNSDMAIDHLFEDKPPYGVTEQVSPLVRRVMAENPSVFTYYGTGTFIVGPPEGGTVAIIDPGPDEDDHIEALLKAVDGQKVSHLLITHTHPDHSPAAAAVKEATGASTFGFGTHPELAIKAYEKRVAKAIEEGKEPEPEDGEGAGDRSFVPDVYISDNEIIKGDGFTFEALHTPGHISNHLCFSFKEESTLFSGDHVMGWSTTVIPAPDGDLNDYLKNMRRLTNREENIYRPTHGPAISNPIPYVESLIAHREKRSQQILDELSKGPAPIMSIVAEIYKDVDEELHKAAAASVYSHLIALIKDERVTNEDVEDFKSPWELA